MSGPAAGFIRRSLRATLLMLAFFTAAGVVGVAGRALKLEWRLYQEKTRPMVFIPAGQFLMGCDPGKDAYCEVDELPARMVSLPAFYMNRWEVTNGSYQRCVAAGACQAPVRSGSYRRWWRRDHPVTEVNWFQARAYCAWQNSRLPTEAEWEWAARGPKRWVWPWGDEFECRRACSSVRPCRAYESCPVGSHPRGISAQGVEDLAGNVWEWTEDAYETSASPEAGETAGQPRVIRGGSWRETEPYSLRSSERTSGPARQGFFNVGFRCVRPAGSD